jgi:hypothetical protein
MGTCVRSWSEWSSCGPRRFARRKRRRAPSDDKLAAGEIADGAAIAAVSLLDIAVLAKQQVPYVAPASGGATLGIAGTF